MRLNELKPAKGSRTAPKRVARGTGSGFGKTAGRGVKGQKSRAGGYHKVGFEGGQMPLQRRLPKRGFTGKSPRARAQVRVSALNRFTDKNATVDLAALKAAGLIGKHVQAAKIILSGELTQAVSVSGIAATAGAQAAIKKAGGKFEAVAAAVKTVKAVKKVKADKVDKVDKVDKSAKSDKAAKSAKSGKSAKPSKSAKSDKPAKAAKPTDQTDQTDPTDTGEE